MENKLTGYQRALIDMTVGEVVGIKSGTGIRKKVYRVEPVTRVTTAQIIIGRDRFWKRNGKQVDGLGVIEIMSESEIRSWRSKQHFVELAREARRNPTPTDDPIEAALRALRDKARTLCEHLQVQVDNRLNAGASAPDWWPEYLQMLIEIEKSESALPSIGLSTTLKPAAAQSSLFR
jgi:hypothetical protein